MADVKLQTLTAEFLVEVDDSAIKSLSARGTPIDPRTEAVQMTDPSPKKRTSYNHLLQKSGSHAVNHLPRNSKPGLNSNVSKPRVASHPLSPSPNGKTQPRSPGTISTVHKRSQTADFYVKSRAPVQRPSKTPENGETRGVQSLGGAEIVQSFPQSQRSFPGLKNKADSDTISPFAMESRDTERGKSLADSRKESGVTREQIDAYVSALSPRFFQDLRNRQIPTPEVEMMIHAFLTLLRLQEPTLDVPDTFKVMHHKTWKAFLALSAHSGRLIQPVKSLPTAIKRGKFPTSVLSPIFANLQSLPIEKITTDDAGGLLFHYVETALLYAKTCEIERAWETNSLQFLQLKDSSPRRKLLVSLMNRTEEQEAEMDGFRVEKVPMISEEEELRKPGFEEEKKVEIEEVKAAEIVDKISSEINEETTKPTSEIDSIAKKPISNKKKKSDFHSSEPSKSPQKPKTPTKTGKLFTPVKRSKPKSDPVPEEPIPPSPDQIRTSLLLDMKLRLFLQEKLFVSKEIPEPKTDLEAESLISLFRTDLEGSGEKFDAGEIAAYVGKADLTQIQIMTAGIKSRQVEALISPQKTASSWTHMEIERQKTKITQTMTRLQPRKSLT